MFGRTSFLYSKKYFQGGGKMFKLIFFVPEEYKERLKNSLFEKGAGKYKNYDMCAFEVKGIGQFRALEKSKPFIGSKNRLEKVTEYRVEMLCDKANIKEIVKTLLKEHPYEEPAYEVFMLDSLQNM